MQRFKQSEEDWLPAKGPGKSGDGQGNRTCGNDTGAATAAYAHPLRASRALLEPGHKSNLDPGKLFHVSKP